MNVARVIHSHFLKVNLGNIHVISSLICNRLNLLPKRGTVRSDMAKEPDKKRVAAANPGIDDVFVSVSYDDAANEIAKLSGLPRAEIGRRIDAIRQSQSNLIGFLNDRQKEKSRSLG